MVRCALSTNDNPYNPFDQFNDWYRYDMLASYDSSALLARIAQTSVHFTEEENAAEIERAIDRIVALDFTNTFIKVKQDVKYDNAKSLEAVS